MSNIRTLELLVDSVYKEFGVPDYGSFINLNSVVFNFGPIGRDGSALFVYVCLFEGINMKVLGGRKDLSKFMFHANLIEELLSWMSLVIGNKSVDSVTRADNISYHRVFEHTTTTLSWNLQIDNKVFVDYESQNLLIINAKYKDGSWHTLQVNTPASAISGVWEVFEGNELLFLSPTIEGIEMDIRSLVDTPTSPIGD
jgi:hypothetical protein